MMQPWIDSLPPESFPVRNRFLSWFISWYWTRRSKVVAADRLRCDADTVDTSLLLTPPKGRPGVEGLGA